MSLDDDSVSLAIQMPQAIKNKINTVIENWEFFQINKDENTIKFYMVVNQIYLKNLIDGTQKFSATQDIRKQVSDKCIIYKSIDFQSWSHDGHHKNIEKYKGNLQINFQRYKCLSVELYLGAMQIQPYEDHLWANLQYYLQKTWKTKTYKLTQIGSKNTYSFQINESEIEILSKKNLIMEISIEKKPARELTFLGIKNQGNTCYMNSILQILFFIQPLRKIIVQYKGNNKVIKALKEIFIELLDVPEGRSSFHNVDAEQLITAYGRFANFPRSQQDIHEFMLGFMEELQNECQQLKQLWLGTSKYILESKQEGKPYSSNINDSFYEIDIHMEDPKGNTFGSLIESLKMLLQEERVDDKIDTDEYGKITVGKYRQFINLPNIIFFNMKRYEFKIEKAIIKKILATMEYPLEINLGFLMKTPPEIDCEYQLFAVTVHRGTTYNSGHYYSYINTSSDLNHPAWYQFNDSIVRKSSQEEALSFTGGKKKQFVFKHQHGRYIQQQNLSQETAYLLTYIRKQNFHEYQRVKTVIPREWMSKRLTKKMEIEKRANKNVEIFVCTDENLAQFDPFENVETMSIPLNEQQNIFDQLRKIQKIYFGCSIASLWKVNKSKRKIKNLLQYKDLPITVGRIFNYKRGHSIPDYILIVPSDKKVYTGEMSLENHSFNKTQKLGIVKIVETITNENQFNQISSIQIINKSYFDEFLSKQQNKRQKKGQIQNKQNFRYDWNDYCVLSFDN